MSKLVLIGIQARTGSTRLPKKAFELISGKTMLDRVIDACKKAAPRINNANGGALRCKIVVVTPTGDPIAREFANRVDIMEGPEHDVLSRYHVAFAHHRPDWLVRITGDCPLIPPAIISKLVSMAYLNNYDYTSNTDPQLRTSIDGEDCEVISARLFEDTHRRADTPYDREHVTPLIIRDLPEWATRGVAMNHFDHSQMKLSVDTPEDLARVREAFDGANRKYQEAVMQFGHHSVHRI